MMFASAFEMAPVAEQVAQPVLGDVEATVTLGRVSLASEEAQITSAIVVTSTADSGPGTLRQALIDVVNGDIVTFDSGVFAPATPAVISLASELPAMTQDGVTVDASNAGVIPDGSAMPPGYQRCLVIESDGNTIRGLQIINCAYDGILIANASHNVIGGDRAVGTGPMGQGNLISGNGGHGIQIHADSRSNQVMGNYVGTDLSGSGDFGNAYSGIALQDEPGPQLNVIGGTTSSTRNVISGNGYHGVRLSDGAHHNTVAGNFIGTDAGGTEALPNGECGVGLFDGANHNLIGGSEAPERNVISGNHAEGVLLYPSTVVSNTVSGNYIGTDATGTVPIGNHGGGIDLHRAACNVIGGLNATPGAACTGECNLISGNTGDNGISVFDPGAVGNLITGNYVGTNVAGTASIPNFYSGITVGGGATDNTIGGYQPGARNLASGNGHSGIYIGGDGTDNNLVAGNYAGTDATGTFAIPNSRSGITVSGGAADNIIGGSVTGAGNLVSGNSETGIYIYGDGTDRNLVSGNYVGTNATGTSSIPNSGSGVMISGGAKGSTIGGDGTGTGNLVSGNSEAGVYIYGEGTEYNRVTGNYVGTDVTGTYAIPNSRNGIRVSGGAMGNSIGDFGVGAGNLVSGNSDGGIYIYGDGTDYNYVIGNLVGTTADASSELGNGRYGVVIFNGPRHNQIGGDTPGQRNVVSGNEWEGIRINWASYNTVIGNYVGTNGSGDGALGNHSRGILVWAASHNTIGGTGPGEGNLFSGNHGEGITVQGERGFFALPDLSGLSPEYAGVFPTIDFPNGQGPFTSVDGITPTTGTGEGFYDAFAARFTGQLHITAAGDYQFSLGSDDGSRLYLDGSLIIDRNYQTGFSTSYQSLYLDLGSYPIQIDYFESYGEAGLAFGASGPAPISLTTDGSTPGLLGEFYLPPEEIRLAENNVVVGNLVGTDASGTAPLGNGGRGITIEDAVWTRVGGPTEAERNVITHNRWQGVGVFGSVSVNNTIQGNWIGIDADSTAGLDPRDLVVADDGTVFLADFGRGVFRSGDRAASWQAASTGLGTIRFS